MKKYQTILISLLLSSVYSYAFDNHSHTNARSVGLGKASCTMTGIWSMQYNQAGLTHLNKISIGLSCENRFLLPELASKGVCFAYPTKWGVLGLQGSRFGYSKYSENMIGLCYARNFSQVISVGLQLDYFNISIGEGLGSTDLITFEIGFQTHISEHIVLGAHAFNPLQSKISNLCKSPSIFSMGMAYHFNKDLTSYFEAAKHSQRPLSLRIGLEYGYKDRFYARMGISSSPLQMSMGFGITFKMMKVDIASSYHQVLGFSPALSITFLIKK